MRVRVDEPGAINGVDLKWRGVALDEFTGRAGENRGGPPFSDKR